MHCRTVSVRGGGGVHNCFSQLIRNAEWASFFRTWVERNRGRYLIARIHAPREYLFSVSPGRCCSCVKSRPGVCAPNPAQTPPRWHLWGVETPAGTAKARGPCDSAGRVLHGPRRARPFLVQYRPQCRTTVRPYLRSLQHQLNRLVAVRAPPLAAALPRRRDGRTAPPRASTVRLGAVPVHLPRCPWRRGRGQCRHPDLYGGW